ncbi:MAG: 2-dehydropantoate 2-reductase [Acetobacteraceae bacterium]|nr:2-dehydropantoate 2-reductase [Acetobacteraceae bacterium]
MRPRIAIVGGGAVGGYVGGHLHRLGHDVTIIDWWPENVEAIRARGLLLTGMTDEETATVAVPIMHLTEVQGLAKQRPIDIAMVCVKSYDTEWATMMIRQYLAPSGFVLSIQNCLNEERIAGVVGWGKVVGCIASSISVDMHAAGQVRRLVPKGGVNHTVFRIGEVHGRITDRVKMLVEMISGIDSAKATTNLWGERWSKLCLNGMRNGVSAATGMSNTGEDGYEEVRRASIRLGGQAVRVGQALGYTLEKLGAFEPEALARAAEGDAAAFAIIDAAMAKAAATSGRNSDGRPSMGQDMLKGRRTEIQFMNGFIADRGAEIGVPAPSHVALTEIVTQVERGELQAGVKNVFGI